MLNVHVGLSRNAPDDWESAATFAVEAERLGAESIWTAETWGFDGATALAYIASRTERVRLGTSILQIGARTPALTAMTALALASMTGDRFVLGLGVSTEQIMQSWHGIPFDSPVQRTRELLEIIRIISSGERLTYRGHFHTLPLEVDARPMRSAAPSRHVPIYLASVGPRNLRLTGELGNGWIGNCFVPERAETYWEPLRRGAEASGRTLEDLELQVPVTLEFDDNLEAVTRRHAEGYAFTFGAMGGQTLNFYVEAWSRIGFEEVREVQRLWLAGDREAAQQHVPLEMAEKSNLLGTDKTVTDRLRAYREAGVNSLRVALRGDNIHQRLDELERLMSLVRTVNEEAT